MKALSVGAVAMFLLLGLAALPVGGQEFDEWTVETVHDSGDALVVVTGSDRPQAAPFPGFAASNVTTDTWMFLSRESGAWVQSVIATQTNGFDGRSAIGYRGGEWFAAIKNGSTIYEVHNSTDGGATWMLQVSNTAGGGNDIEGIFNAYPGQYGFQTTSGGTARGTYSDDGGATLAFAFCAVALRIGEELITYLGNGEWISAARTNPNGFVEIARCTGHASAPVQQHIIHAVNTGGFSHANAAFVGEGAGMAFRCELPAVVAVCWDDLDFSGVAEIVIPTDLLDSSNIRVAAAASGESIAVMVQDDVTPTLKMAYSADGGTSWATSVLPNTIQPSLNAWTVAFAPGSLWVYYVDASTGDMMAASSSTIPPEPEPDVPVPEPGNLFGDDGIFFGGNKTVLADAMQITTRALEVLYGVIIIIVAAGIGFGLLRIVGALVGAFVGLIIAFAFGLIPLWVIILLLFVGAAFFYLRGYQNG